MQEMPPILSVSELNQVTQSIVEREIGVVYVRGEISNLATPTSGHMYFSLKDEKSQVRCAMFRNKPGAKGFIPKNGTEVVAHGLASVYSIRGDYQLIVETMELSGDGILRAKFEALKTKLEKAGYFDQSKKKPLPKWPNTIGIVTSPTGAAIRDILTVMKRRSPSITAIIYPCVVQGENAASEIARSIFAANQRKECDVLIISRGGGSLEDLWPFNEELVAQAIFDSLLPIVSGIGHEVDITIADLVVDARAPTPSAAAEIVTPETSVAYEQFESLKKRLLLASKIQINTKTSQLSTLHSKIRHPRKDLEFRFQQTDDLLRQLYKNASFQMQFRRMSFENQHSRLKNLAPKRSIEKNRSKLTDAILKLKTTVSYKYKENQTKTQHLITSIKNLGHQRTLERGYTLVMDDKGKLVKTPKELTIGQPITTLFKSGKVDSVVKLIEES